MKILISGYGKMGREIEKLALLRGHEIAAKVDNESQWNDFLNADINTDLVIDFSLPYSTIANIERSINSGLPIVVGTTGWQGSLDYVTKFCIEKNGALFYSPNYSLGVNIFFHLNKELARIMRKIENYTVRINETHHVHKLDSPSGTAIKTAEDIINQCERVKEWKEGTSKDATEISIFSNRINDVFGIHEVVWESESDQLMISHEAKNRTGFAIGALLAAEFLIDKRGIFTMENLLKALLS